MNADTKPTGTMVPISGRLPDDLYHWLSTLPMEGATTVSDKIRAAVSTLKRLHDGDSDYMGALAMQRDLAHTTRDQIAELENSSGVYSAVLAAFVEHLPALIATLNSAQVRDINAARQLEDQLVRRTFQLAEALLRQAVTPNAVAYDEKVVHKHAGRFTDLIQATIPATPKEGGIHG